MSSTTGKVMLKAISKSTEEVVEFYVDDAVALQSETLRPIIEDGLSHKREPAITFYNIDAETLAKIVEYCEKHVPKNKNGDDDDGTSAVNDEVLKQWDSNYLDVQHSVLFDLFVAADCLDIKGLLDLLRPTVSNLIRGNSPVEEEIRQILNTKTEFTPEDLAAIRSDWNLSAYM